MKFTPARSAAAIPMATAASRTSATRSTRTQSGHTRKVIVRPPCPTVRALTTTGGFEVVGVRRPKPAGRRGTRPGFRGSAGVEAGGEKRRPVGVADDESDGSVASRGRRLREEGWRAALMVDSGVSNAANLSLRERTPPARSDERALAAPPSSGRRAVAQRSREQSWPHPEGAVVRHPPHHLTRSDSSGLEDRTPGKADWRRSPGYPAGAPCST